ncbi:uncharacterized protein LOC112556454 isoform X1 [Pomacea canaliculata]|uniref:uncharacterized protein LOC112556454 isoform X1 n=1 Tax=Pomacea canaliculata TaxID=400727 RepID=UPI000D7374F6|nr:uncharacterized protein LOC112556454 isoform X1 [Pomacea canaliculata]
MQQSRDITPDRQREVQQSPLLWFFVFSCCSRAIKMDTGERSLYKNQCEELVKDRQIFREKLQEFPHLFKLKDYSDVTLERKQFMVDKLKSERTDDGNYRTPVETICISNLIAFLSFLTKDVETAVDETEKVLATPNNDTNIVALANMAIMKWEMGKRVEGETFVKKLEELRGQRNFEDKVTDAKAEMAYCYSRMGMSFASLAVDIFEEVVTVRPHDYTWKLGLALVLRRFTHTNYRMYFGMSSDLTSKRSLRAFDLLFEIRNSDAPEGQRAQALVELGVLLDQWWNADLSRVLKKAKEKGLTATHCYEEAVSLGPADVHVLVKCGKFFKNKNKLGKSREILERAIAIRPTTTAHHYLGNTFIKMAVSHQKQCQQESTRRQTHSVGRRLSNMTVSETNRTHVSQSPAASATSAYRSILKSPRRLPSLTRDDMYVKDALHHFQESIRLSHKENSSAVYDLGLLFTSLGNDDKALDLFFTLINEQESRGSPLQIINAYEQAGLIHMRKSVRAGDDNAAEGCRLLQTALQLQCQAGPSLPTGNPDFKTLWPSFYELCNAARNKDSRYLRFKLFEMVNNYAECLNVLDEMSKFSHKEAVDPKFLEKRLICYVNLERYDDALLFLSLLEVTEEREIILQWSDPDLPRRVRIMAAKKMLLNINDTRFGTTEDKVIKKCFLQAITAKSSQSDEETQREYVDNGWDEDLEPKWWHVMILHDLEDDDMKVKGLAIKNILQNVCGLRVTCMSDDDDVRPYHPEVWKILENAEKSQILVVLCGTKTFSDDFCNNFLQVLPEVRSSGNSTRKALLALQIENAHQPKNLHPDRWFQCSPTLYGTFEVYTPELISDICKLFCFLANISV